MAFPSQDAVWTQIQDDLCLQTGFLCTSPEKIIAQSGFHAAFSALIMMVNTITQLPKCTWMSPGIVHQWEFKWSTWIHKLQSWNDLWHFNMAEKKAGFITSSKLFVYEPFCCCDTEPTMLLQLMIVVNRLMCVWLPAPAAAGEYNQSKCDVPMQQKQPHAHHHVFLSYNKALEQNSCRSQIHWRENIIILTVHFNCIESTPYLRCRVR